MKNKFAWCVVMVFLFAGCARYSLVESSKAIKVGDILQLETPISWSKVEQGNMEIWTVDGPQLQRLTFFKGIEEGKPLYPDAAGNKDKIPLYENSMSAMEIMELFEATWARSGFHKIQTSNLRPDKLGSLDGFRFELRYATEEGLSYEGFVMGAIKGNKLIALTYEGTSLCHFEKHKQDVEKIVSSINVL